MDYRRIIFYCFCFIPLPVVAAAYEHSGSVRLDYLHYFAFFVIGISFVLLIVRYRSQHKTLMMLQESNRQLITAKTALTEAEARFALMAETTDDIVWISDASHSRLIYVNDAYERIFGKPKETLYDNLESYTEYLHPDDRDLLDLLGKNREIEKNSIRFRIINQETGDVRWLHSRFSPYTDSDGKVLFIGGIASDITKLTEADAEIASSRQIIAQQSKLAALGEMIGAISHQWRQPLNALSLYIQMLNEINDDGGFSDETAAAICLRESGNLIRHMSETIEDFRDFFKSAKQPEPFDIPKTVMQTLRMVSPQFKADKISYHVNCTCSKKSFSCINTYDTVKTSCHYQVFGVENEFRHALLNILQNAREALIQKETPEKTVQIDLSAENGIFRIAITDSAGGIDKAIIAVIFDRYTTGKTDGTGMGLNMTRSIIKKAGGSIHAENTAKGAKFTIEIPCIKAESH